jgi:hypothetical protein
VTHILACAQSIRSNCPSAKAEDIQGKKGPHWAHGLTVVWERLFCNITCPHIESVSEAKATEEQHPDLGNHLVLRDGAWGGRQEVRAGQGQDL